MKVKFWSQRTSTDFYRTTVQSEFTCGLCFTLGIDEASVTLSVTYKTGPVKG